MEHGKLGQNCTKQVKMISLYYSPSRASRKQWKRWEEQASEGGSVVVIRGDRDSIRNGSG
jgi:hypothetical protein